METNMLDDFFRKRLQNHSEIPQGIVFDKKRVYTSLESQIAQKSTIKTSWKYAAVIVLFLSSGYWHWHQSDHIKQQQLVIAEQGEKVEKVQQQSVIKMAEQQVMIDSLQNRKSIFVENDYVASLPSLPAVVTTHELSVAKTAAITIREPLFITDKDIPNQKSSVPELDLPVYYESERLANNNHEASNGRAFRRKLTELLNN